MDEKVRNDEKNVMLVREAGKDGKLKGVSQIDNDGNIQTVDPTSANLASLFSVNTNDPAVEAFLNKFLEASQNPVKTGISDLFIMTGSGKTFQGRSGPTVVGTLSGRSSHRAFPNRSGSGRRNPFSTDGCLENRPPRPCPQRNPHGRSGKTSEGNVVWT